MHAKPQTRPAYLLLLLAIVSMLALALPGAAWATQSKSANFNMGFKTTGVAAQDILAAAMAQNGRTQGSLGYTEGWCADFTSDCAKVIGQSQAVPFNGMVSGLYYDVLDAGGAVVTSPQAGDLVFFITGSGKNASFDHVGIMSDKTNCISGNMGMGKPTRSVAICKVAWVIPGATIKYVRPAYTSGAYTVKFRANGATSGKMSAQTIVRDKSKRLKANKFVRKGYTFVGWNTKADGSGTAFTNKQKVKNIAMAGKTVKLYAQWKKTPYKVKFMANGGVGKMSKQKIVRGKSKALKANTFTRQGYTFKGWNTKKDGSGKSYKDMQKVKNLAKAGKTIKLYAQWKKAKA